MYRCTTWRAHTAAPLDLELRDALLSSPIRPSAIASEAVLGWIDCDLHWKSRAAHPFSGMSDNVHEGGPVGLIAEADR